MACEAKKCCNYTKKKNKNPILNKTLANNIALRDSDKPNKNS